MIHIMYNPLANGKKDSLDAVMEKFKFITDTKEFHDVRTIPETNEFLKPLPKDDVVVFCGGDGSLNHLANEIDISKVEQRLFYFPNGTGNDFYTDVKDSAKIENGMIYINDYLKNLPTVTVNGMTKKFINGIGFGIDGYCCEEGDKQRANSDKPVNYTAIAIKGLLFKFKPRTATVTVDGVTKEFKNCWLAPTMFGRYYGGGMQIAPNQDRTSSQRTITTVAWYCPNKFRMLACFPSVFKGEHTKYTKLLTFMTGKEVKVEFSTPCALQIDGETVLNVKSYTVKID